MSLLMEIRLDPNYYLWTSSFEVFIAFQHMAYLDEKIYSEGWM